MVTSLIVLPYPHFVRFLTQYILILIIPTRRHAIIRISAYNPQYKKKTKQFSIIFPALSNYCMRAIMCSCEHFINFPSVIQTY